MFDPGQTFKVGDTITFDGMMLRNRDRRWWQWWKPRYVPDNSVWRVVATNEPDTVTIPISMEIPDA